MVEELFTAMRNQNVEESYYDFALEQIDSALIRDLYMSSIGEAFEGYEDYPGDIARESEQLNDFMMDSISTEDMLNESILSAPTRAVNRGINAFGTAANKHAFNYNTSAAYKKKTDAAAAVGAALGAAALYKNSKDIRHAAGDALTSYGNSGKEEANEGFNGDTISEGIANSIYTAPGRAFTAGASKLGSMASTHMQKYNNSRAYRYGTNIAGLAAAKALYDNRKEIAKKAGNALNSDKDEEASEGYLFEGSDCHGPNCNCSECEIQKECSDPAIIRAIDLLPESDPRDAGTFFSRTNAVNVECDRAIKEQYDLIDAIIPDTLITM